MIRTALKILLRKKTKYYLCHNRSLLKTAAHFNDLKLQRFHVIYSLVLALTLKAGLFEIIFLNNGSIQLSFY